MHSDAWGFIGLNRSEYCSWDAFNLNRCIGCGAHNQPGCLGCWKDADRFLFSARNLEFARYRYFLFRCTQFLVVCYAGGWRGSEGTGAVKFTCVLWRRSKTAIELALCFVPTKLNKSLKMHIYQIQLMPCSYLYLCLIFCVWCWLNVQEWHDDKLRWEPSEYGGVEEIYVPRCFLLVLFLFCLFVVFFVWRRSICPGAF